MSDDERPQYLDLRAVARRCGIKRQTLEAYRLRGTLPEADAYWLNHPLWLPETIDRFRADKGKPMHKRAVVVKPPPIRLDEMPQPPASTTRKRRPAAKKKKAPAQKVPSVVAVTRRHARSPEERARVAGAAAALRAEGLYCTAEEALELLAAKEPERLEYERRQMRERLLVLLTKAGAS